MGVSFHVTLGYLGFPYLHFIKAFLGWEEMLFSCFKPRILTKNQSLVDILSSIILNPGTYFLLTWNSIKIIPQVEMYLDIQEKEIKDTKAN